MGSFKNNKFYCNEKMKLTLNKETIAQLNDENLDAIKGGALWSFICPSKICVSVCLTRPDKTCGCPTVTCGSCACSAETVCPPNQN